MRAAVLAGLLVPAVAMAAPAPATSPGSPASPVSPAPAAAPRPESPPPSPSRPDEAAIAMAAESNLEWPRAGFRIGIGVGPALQVGSIDESSGAGGGLSIRVGTASSPRLAWILEAVGTAYLREDDDAEPQINRSSLLVLGAQVHATEAVWVRGGAGLAQFAHPSEPDDEPFDGIGAVAGAGFDLVRRGSLALSAECALLAALYGDAGQVVSGFCGLGATSY